MELYVDGTLLAPALPMQTRASFDSTRRTQGIVLMIVGFLTPIIGRADTPLTAEQIVVRLNEADDARDRVLQGFSVTREYRLQNEKGTKHAATVARMDYMDNHGKTFRVLKEDDGFGIFRRVIHKVMDAEVETAKDGSEDLTKISKKNYDFKLLGTQLRDGRSCYVLELHPKLKTKYLLEGKVWIDSTDFATVRIEGRPAASVSIFVGKPFIEQSFTKVGDYWLLSKIHSITDVIFFGQTDLVVASKDYAIREDPAVVASRAKAGGTTVGRATALR